MNTAPNFSAPLQALHDGEASATAHFAKTLFFATSAEDLRGKLSYILPVHMVAAYVTLARVYETIYRKDFSSSLAPNSGSLSAVDVFGFEGFLFCFRTWPGATTGQYRAVARKCPVVKQSQTMVSRYIEDVTYEKSITSPLFDVWSHTEPSSLQPPEHNLWGVLKPSLRVVANGCSNDIKVIAAREGNSYGRVANSYYDLAVRDLSTFNSVVAARSSSGYNVGEMLKVVLDEEVQNAHFERGTYFKEGLLNMLNTFCEAYAVS